MGFNITSLNSEMSYMYYVELGNLGRYDIYGNRRIGDVFTNPGPFINLNDRYWTQSPYPGPDLAFSFRFLHPAGDGDGVQTATWLQDRAWAVRDMGPSAIVRLRDLATAVLSLNLRTGIENSLDVKLQSAISAIDDLSENNDIAAINSLGAFINAVEAQMGKELSDEEADYLIETANSIIAQIESE